MDETAFIELCNGLLKDGAREITYNTWDNKPQHRIIPPVGKYVKAVKGKFEGSIFELREVDVLNYRIQAKLKITGMKAINSTSKYSNWELTNETRPLLVSDRSRDETFDFFDQPIRKGDYVYGVDYDQVIFGVVENIHADNVMVSLLKSRDHFKAARSYNNSNSKRFQDLRTWSKTISVWSKAVVKIDPKEGFKFNLQV